MVGFGIATTSAHHPAGDKVDAARRGGGFGVAPRCPPRGHWAASAARPVDGAGPSPSPLGSPPLFPGVGPSGGGRRGGAAEGRPVTSPPFSASGRRAAGFAGQQLGNMLAAMRRSGPAWTRALLLQLLLAGPGGCLSRQELFPFGPGQGDLELEAGDDRISPALELKGALRFFDKSDIHSVYVSATRGRRWRHSGEGVGAERASEGRLGRAGGAGEAGWTWASWAGTGTRWPRGLRVRRLVSKPEGAPTSTRPADDSLPPGHCRPRSTRVWGARPSARPARAARLRDPGTRDPRQSFLSRCCGRQRRREIDLRLAIVQCPWAQDSVQMGTGGARSLGRAKARAGSQPARGPRDSRRCGGRKKPPKWPLGPGNLADSPLHLCVWTLDMSWQ